MIKRIFIFIAILFLLSGCLEETQKYQQIKYGMLVEFHSDDPNRILLPDPFRIYEQNGVLLNHSYPGYSKIQLPANSDYSSVPGCYIVCYSHDKQSGVYGVDANTYVNGLVRVAGYYHNRICLPDGEIYPDISKLGWFDHLCSEKLRSCIYNDCWAGNDTGAWLGIR